MTEYRISETLSASTFTATAGSSWGENYKYDFKIDLNGNVYIKEGQAHYTSPIPIPRNEFLSIVDNIKIPEHMMEIINNILQNNFVKPSRHYNNTHISLQKIGIFFDLIKNIKKIIKEMSENPHNSIDFQTQLELYINKNKILEEEIENMNKKIKNIQTAYFDAINDNEEMKKQNKILTEKISKLEEKIKTGNIVYVETPKYIETTSRDYSTYRGTINPVNTGTLPNAANRMVYNEYKGIYEPEEN
jgi:hypothetical protein